MSSEEMIKKAARFQSAATKLRAMANSVGMPAVKKLKLRSDAGKLEGLSRLLKAKLDGTLPPYPEALQRLLDQRAGAKPKVPQAKIEAPGPIAPKKL